MSIRSTPEGRSLLDQPQMVDQPGRLPPELRVVRRVTVSEHVGGSETEVRGDRGPARVENRKQTAEIVGMGVEQVIDQLDEPRSVEEVDPPRAAVLFRFPAHQGAQFRGVV